MTQTFSLIVEGFLLLIVGSFGLVGNSLSIVVFYRKKFQRNFHRLMSFLAFYDLIYLILALTIFSLPQLNPEIHEEEVFNHLMPVLLPLAHISLTGSIYFTVSITIERYITISHNMCVWKYYIIPIITCSTLFNVPKFFELTVIAVSNNSSQTVTENPSFEHPENNFTESQISWVIHPKNLRMDPNYIKYYLNYSNFIINSLLPFAILIILNYFICKRLSSLSPELDGHSASSSPPRMVQRREMLLAHISLVIVLVFIFSHSVKWIPNIWELRQAEMGQLDAKFPETVNHIAEVSHLTTVFSSSVNFYIYLVKYYHLLPNNQETDNTEMIIQDDLRKSRNVSNKLESKSTIRIKVT